MKPVFVLCHNCFHGTFGNALSYHASPEIAVPSLYCSETILPPLTTTLNLKATIPFEYLKHFANDNFCKLKGFMILCIDPTATPGICLITTAKAQPLI